MTTAAQIEAFLIQEKQEFRMQADGNVAVEGFSSSEHYKEGTLTWIKSAERWHDGLRGIALCIVQEGVELPLPNQILCKNSKAVFFSLIERFFTVHDEDEALIGQHTVIGKHVKLGKNVRIGHNCSITGEVEIGDDTVISDNVVIKNRVRIGKRCTVQALSMIGEDGFGAYEEENHHRVMIRHYGGVTIGDDVFVSSHVSIQRGTIDDTYIGSGTKIAPCTLVAHNSRVGENAVLICSHLYGSVSVGDNAWIAGSIVKNQCKVGDNALVGIGSAVLSDIAAGQVVAGVPAKALRDRVK